MQNLQQMQTNFSLGQRETCKPQHVAGFLPLALPDLYTSLREEHLDTMLWSLQVSLSISAASRNHTPQGKGSEGLVSFTQPNCQQSKQSIP